MEEFFFSRCDAAVLADVVYLLARVGRTALIVDHVRDSAKTVQEHIERVVERDTDPARAHDATRDVNVSVTEVGVGAHTVSIVLLHVVCDFVRGVSLRPVVLLRYVIWEF